MSGVSADGPDEDDPLIGRILAGKMEVQSMLGEGAMGRVYRAKHLALDRTVAIKVLHRELSVDKSLIGRFRAEARAASRLTHPNGVQVLDFGEDGEDSLLYIAMEFLEGQDMSALLRTEGRLDPVRSAKLMTQTLAALADAHDQGIIHRDMKPGNVVITHRRADDGTQVEFVKVCDFGLAKILDRDPNESTSGPLTQQGQVFGTPSFMSPEQAKGEVLDARTDLYSCGCILYRMLSGRMPFDAESVVGVLMKQISEEPPPIESLVDGVDPRLVTIVRRAMRKDRSERYGSAREMRADLVEYLEAVGPGEGVAPLPLARSASRSGGGQSLFDVGGLEDTFPSADPVPSPPSSPTPSMQMTQSTPAVATPWWVMAPGMLALLLIGGIAAFVVLRIDKAETPPSRPPPEIVVARADPSPNRQGLGEMPAELRDESAEMAKGAAVPSADVPARPVEPEETASSGKREARAKKRARPKPAKAAEKDARSEADDQASPSENEAPGPEAVEPNSTTQVEMIPPVKVESPKMEVVPVPEPKPAPPAPKPAAPARASKVDVKLIDVEVGGGMSRSKVKQKLRRPAGDAKRCFTDHAGLFAVGDKGKVELEGKLGFAGRLELSSVAGAPEPILACIRTAFDGAMIVRPDTGGAELSASVRYRAQ